MTVPTVTLGEITHRITKGTTPTSIGRDFAISGISFVKVESIGADGRIQKNRLAAIDPTTHIELKRSMLEHDDLLFTIAGTIGRVARVRADLLPANTNQAVAIVRADRSKVDVGYLYYVLRAKDGLDHARSRLVQSVQANLSLGDLSEMTLPLPSMPEQRGIAEVLGALDDKIAANAKLVATAEDLMRSIAASASGETALTDIARQSTAQVKPECFEDEVAHFSLPAFDEGALPECGPGSSIRSNKFTIGRPAVLVSKLNPRIPRLWNVSVLPRRMALASTEFVVVSPIDVGVSELWSSLAQPDVWTTLEGKVAGTSGSHQRVKPVEIMALHIKDPRTLPADRRASLEGLGTRGDSARQESVRLAEVRDVLLPLLMSGKIRVKDAERVVAGETVGVV